MKNEGQRYLVFFEIKAAPTCNAIHAVIVPVPHPTSITVMPGRKPHSDRNAYENGP